MAESLISDEWCEWIRNYYTNEFTDPEFPRLKFRYIKLYGYDNDTGKIMWFYLHRILNRRALINSSLKVSIAKIIEDGIYPIRLFFSASEWSYPYLIHGLKSRRTRYLSPGIIPIESDIDLESSKVVAKTLIEKFDWNFKLVYSGNKSIHVWYYEIPGSHNIQTVEEDLSFREEIFERVSASTPLELDRRTTVDSYRVLPVIGSLNGFTMRPVKEFLPEEL